MLKIRLITIGVLTGALLLIFLGAANAAVEKGPYMIYNGVNTQMQVLWQLDSSQSCTIEWGEDTSYSTGTAVTTEYNSGTYGHQHTYTITGLAPDTKYFYQVVCTPDNVGNGSFYTAPLDDAGSVEFMVYGDSRSHPETQDRVNAQMITTYTEDPGFQSLTIHTGDWVASDTEYDWASEFFDPAYLNSHEFQANMPINGCIGNHEHNGIIFEKYFPYPYEPGGFYWSFDYGPAHITIVNDNHPDLFKPATEQYKWLENDLASTDKDWKVLIYHKPGWSAGPHHNRAGVQDYIQPLCLTYGVEVVFASHNHNYARAVVDGVQHITTGGGGAGLATPDPNYENIVATAKSHQFCTVDIQGNQLVFSSIDTDGNIIDSFNITHPAKGPSVTTGTATSLTGNSATLNGMVNPNGTSTTYHFEYGTTTNYGSATPSASAGSGTSTVSVNAAIYGLISDTTYHYRLVANNSEGTSNGDDKTLSTTIVYVESTGSCGGNVPCYTTIQEAIDDVISAATIKIAQGTYDEDIVMDRTHNLTFSGGWDSTFTNQLSDTFINSLNIDGLSGAVETDNIIIQ